MAHSRNYQRSRGENRSTHLSMWGDAFARVESARRRVLEVEKVDLESIIIPPARKRKLRKKYDLSQIYVHGGFQVVVCGRTACVGYGDLLS